MLPFALVGTVVHYPAYRLAGFFATGILFKVEDDVASTFKITGAMLLFPLTWIAVSVVCLLWLGWIGALGALVLIPFSGFIAIRFAEELDSFIGSAKAVVYFITRRWFFNRLLVERRAIREEIQALGNEARRDERQAVES
jgi:hypothetical protein